MDKYRVVFHLDEPSKGCAKQVLRNIENLIDDLSENNVEIELVTNGVGVKRSSKVPNHTRNRLKSLLSKEFVSLPVPIP